MSEQWGSWADQAAVNAVWARVNESPEWIAERAELVAQRTYENLSVDDWSIPVPPPQLRVPWPGGGAEGAAFVYSQRVQAVNEEASSLFGYSFSLIGESPEFGLHMMVHAGGNHVGYRTPLHVCTVDVLPVDDGLFQPEDADVVLAACVEAWEPLMVCVSSAEVNRIARRGNWLVPPGYRLWLSSELGQIQGTAAGVSAHRLGAGTLLTVDDDELPAERVVGIVMDSLRMNGIDELPH